MKLRFLLFLAINILFSFSSCIDKIANESPNPPSELEGLNITLGDAFDITSFGAKFPFSFTYTGSDKLQCGEVILYNTADKTDTHCYQVSLDENIIQIDDLLPGMKYEYSVRILSYSSSKISESKHFTTLPRRAAPEGAVDFGLSVFWSAKNLGSTFSDDAGDYYSWGDVIPYAKRDERAGSLWSNYK